MRVFGPINQPNFPLESCPEDRHTQARTCEKESERAAKKSEYEIPFSTAAHPPSYPRPAAPAAPREHENNSAEKWRRRGDGGGGGRDSRAGDDLFPERFERCKT